MKDYKGIPFHLVDDAQVRDQLATLDEWARQASFGFGRIEGGERPNSSGVAVAASDFPHNLLDSTVHLDTITASPTRGALVVGNDDSTSLWELLSLGAANTFLGSNGTDATWTAPGALTRVDDTNVTLTLGGAPTTALLRAASITAGWTGQLTIARGGTGQSSALAAFNALSPLTTRGDLLTRDASNNVRLAVGAAPRILQSDGTDPSWVALSADATLAAGGALTLATVNANVGSFGSATQVGTFTVNAKGLVTAVANVTISGVAPSAHNILSASHGDTLTASVIRGDVIIGNSTPKWSRLAVGASATFIRSDGTDPSWDTIHTSDVPDLSGIYQPLDADLTELAGVANVRGDILITNSVPNWVRLAKGATAGMWLRSDGTDVAWSTTTIPNVGTSGGILGFTSTSALASSVLLTTSALVLGGGAGATPTPLGSLGTTTTLLHGNAAGAPTFAAVSLTADVSGVLPIANGGSNKALTLSAGGILWTDADSFEVLAGTATAGQILRSGASVTPSWSTATYPATAAISSLLYASGANVYANLAPPSIGTTNFLVSLAADGYVPKWEQDSNLEVTFAGFHIDADVVIAGGGELIFSNSLPVGGSTWVNFLHAPNTTSTGALSQLPDTTDLAPGGVLLSWLAPVATGQLPAAGAVPYGVGVHSAMAALPIGTAGNILTVNAGATAPQWSTNASIVDIARSFSTLQTFPDNAIKIVGSATSSKALLFELDGATAAKTLTLTSNHTLDRNITFPNATTTLGGLSVDQTWTGTQTFVPTGMLMSGVVNDVIFQFTETVSGFTTQILGPSAITANRAINTPDADGTMLLTAGAQNVASKTFLGSCLLDSTNATNGVSFSDHTTTTKKLRVLLSGAVGNNTLTLTNTAARNYSLLNEAGTVNIAGAAAVASGANATAQAPGKVDVTAQGADFAQAQIVTTASVGFWRLDSYLEDTAAGAGSGIMTTTWGWTDDVGATTDATQTLALTATGRSSFSRIVYVASGHITVKCLNGGAYLLGAQYAFRARATFLG